ncbi:Tat (twin-arginine translocation) pathway signal sequence containing protein [Mycobacterium colombiense]|uniref:Tat (Twin-arginine translocation) pathway signal sequence containing protein n=2 Tax=Mycobacterium colombiense TaxID=339268 RepID=A0A329LW93_9MYCO|nr:Tat (twin-arginine translocation) pathway signal sequence containing protein [Mycobacterium colombiense]
MPGVHGGGAPVSPVGLGQGGQPGLAQAFTSGLATGQATGPGGQAFTAGPLQAMDAGGPQTPQATPAVTPTVPSAGAFIPTGTPVDAPPAASPAPVATGGGGSVTPVMTGASWSSPAPTLGGGSSIPSGSLPAYGSDLRPPVVAPPSVPSTPAGPVSGAAVASSPASSPSAGGPLVSPVERTASGAAAGQAGAGSSTMAGATAASAATGATAGAVSSRTAEQQRLQRIVDAVARQEPRLSWAAGLRDDGATTLLVTDLAAGWIPPHVRLPAHVTLLEPSARRHDANVVDLLGAITVAAAHHANTYVAEPGPDEPALSGDRPARSAAPEVEELGPTLVDAVRRRDGLPRIAQAVAAPAVRKTGVLESETEMLRECTAEIQHTVLNAYPNHDRAAVGDWMLLAAVEALIDGHGYLANYHLAWFDAISHRSGS